MNLIIAFELFIKDWFHGVVTSQFVLEWPLVSEGVRGLHYIFFEHRGGFMGFLRAAASSKCATNKSVRI